MIEDCGKPGVGTGPGFAVVTVTPWRRPSETSARDQAIAACFEQL